MQITNEDLKRIIKEELDAVLSEKEGKKDACYHKVKSRYDVWPSAYASGALVKCRKVGAKNWGNSKKEGIEEEFQKHDMYDPETGEKHKAEVEADHTDMAGKGFVHVDTKKIEKILRDEGGAAGMDPFIKEFGKGMKKEIEKALEEMPNVAKHEDGDYILDDDADVDLAEKKLTKRDKQQKEKFVKGMKKNKKGFEKDYGKDAESVMYATATKMAKEKK
jgi:hypothetical protein